MLLAGSMIVFMSRNTGISAYQSGPVSEPFGQAIPASPAVEQYLKGQAAFDASPIWNAMSDSAKAAAQSSGQGVDTLQTQLDQLRQQGGQFGEVVYVGGYPMQDGGRFYFYVLSVRNAGQPGQVQQVPFVFTVDRDGKIAKVE